MNAISPERNRCAVITGLRKSRSSDLIRERGINGVFREISSARRTKRELSFVVIEIIAKPIWKFLLSTSKEIESKTSKIEEQFVAIRIFNVQLVDYLI